MDPAPNTYPFPTTFATPVYISLNQDFTQTSIPLRRLERPPTPENFEEAPVYEFNCGIPKRESRPKLISGLPLPQFITETSQHNSAVENEQDFE